jgi:hypothetical protein
MCKEVEYLKRTDFLAASVTLAAASAAIPAIAESVPGGTSLVERKADFDNAAFARLVDRASQVRELWEAVSFHPVVWNNIKNAMNGLQFGFGYPADQILMASCGHGASAVYTYSDEIWQKYKLPTLFKLANADGTPALTNTFYAKHNAVDPNSNPNDATSMYQDTSIEMLQLRGLVVLTCHTAVEEQSRAIVKAGNAPAGMTATDVADDILTHLIPGAFVVPSMAGAIAVLQHVYQYAYATLAV